MMKKSIYSLLALALAAVSASAQQKILTVNISECFEAFHETEMVNSTLESARRNLDAFVQQSQQSLEERARPLQERVQEIQENPGLSQQAKEEQLRAVQAEAQPLQQEGQQLEQEVQQRQQQLRQEFARKRQNLLDKIRNAATTVAIREGATLLLDTSDPTGAGVPTVVYRDQGADITGKVITELNKNAPSDSDSE